jgi:hypothetical protein
MTFPDEAYPNEDSDDLSDDEIAASIETASAGVLASRMVALLHLSCASCGKPMNKVENAIRRRKPDLFSRLTTTCESGHQATQTFRVNWLEGS